MGLVQSFVPVARPMKLATPIGALSGKSVQVSLPAVVSITAVGFADASGLACDHVKDDRRTSETRIRQLRMRGSSEWDESDFALYDSGRGITWAGQEDRSWGSIQIEPLPKHS